MPASRAMLTALLIVLMSGAYLLAAETNTTVSPSNGTTCATVSLLPFTYKGKPNPQFSIHVAVDHMAATLMAIDHFNDRDPSVVADLASREIADCDVSIPAIPGWTIADDGDFTTDSVAGLLGAREERRVCAVVGPYRNKAALGAAHVSGAMGSPMISYGAADTAKLGRLHLYPLTAKNTADEYDRADAVMDYLKNYLGRDYVTLLHTTDMGDHAVKVLDYAAKKHKVEFLTEAIKPPWDKPDGPFSPSNAMRRIIESGHRTVIIALYMDANWRPVEKHAEMFNMTGPDAGYFWLSWDTTHTSLLTAETDSVSRQKLLNGMGTINMLDGYAYQGSEDPFLRSWRSQNASFVRRLAEINPIAEGENGYYRVGDDYFSTTRPTPSLYSSYIYDSIIAIGIGACRARAKELSAERESQQRGSSRTLQMVRWPNTGTTDTFFNELVTVEFEGASGSVILHNEALYNRNIKTIPFGMYNIRLEGSDPVSADELNSRGFKSVLTSYKLAGQKSWSLASEEEDFIYADGTTNQPILKTPDPEEEEDRTVIWVVIGFLGAGLVAAVLVYFHMAHKRRQADSIWSVEPSELKFHQPPEVIGQGTFGLVVLAEYRGTRVAVKRVIPLSERGEIAGTNQFFLSNIVGGSDEIRGLHGIEKGEISSGETRRTKGMGHKSGSFECDDGGSGTNTWLPMVEKQNQLSKRLRTEFISEMRHLSKLRHPCITTVMGAVIAKKHDPMLVMEFMDHGSLHDLLHNETLLLDGDLVLPILRDIAQGLRFLHAANPTVIHGDLKAANVLVDSKFRAKVADFGLSQKKRLGATGTPFWMAPELLRRESGCTAASDIYSFGIILYEVYSRKDPYEGENYRDVISMIADPLVSKRPPVPSSCPKAVATIMQNCLKAAGEFRLSAEELDKELNRLDVASAGPTTAMTSLHKDKTEHLLYELLPRHVADVLRSGGKVEPESKDLVTIFFSDIVGFTDISSELTPIKISDMLDRLYHEFDELSKKHDVFKVETIGDAYMAVTNLIKEQAEDHAKRIALFAIDAVKAANRTLIDTDDPDKGRVNIRVGFHSGSVVANVVGTRNPRYCLFGDTVNTASRMESNSKENCIHCSARAAGLLLLQAPKLNLEHRGRIKVKGKGEMRTFWVNEKAPEVESSDRAEDGKQRKLDWM